MPNLLFGKPTKANNINLLLKPHLPARPIIHIHGWLAFSKLRRISTPSHPERISVRQRVHFRGKPTTVEAQTALQTPPVRGNKWLNSTMLTHAGPRNTASTPIGSRI